MGLAHEVTPGEWRVRSDFQTVLKAMQRTTDRQKMLASHGAIVSDERLQLVVYDPRQQRSLEGKSSRRTGKTNLAGLPAVITSY